MLTGAACARVLTFAVLLLFDDDGSPQAEAYHFPVTTLDDVAITVRSAQDPFMEAEYATKGSLNFGWGSHSAVLVGWGMLALGFCLGLSPGVALWGAYQEAAEEERSKGSYAGIQADFDDFEEGFLDTSRRGAGGGVSFGTAISRANLDAVGEDDDENALDAAAHGGGGGGSGGGGVSGRGGFGGGGGNAGRSSGAGAGGGSGEKPPKRTGSPVPKPAGGDVELAGLSNRGQMALPRRKPSPPHGGEAEL